MQDKFLTSTGIVISRKNYSDSDRILTILSHKSGKVRVIAKGIRKPKSKKRGHLEVFSYIKFSCSSGKSWMPIMTEAETINSFHDLRNDLGKVSVAYYFMEVVDKITAVDEINSQVFDLLLESLEKLEKSDKLKTLRKEFVQKILMVSGFLPKESNSDKMDVFLENVLEKKITSKRIGKLVLS